MQHHKKAIIVGEKTVGGTHPGSFVRVHPNFAVFVPLSWFIYPTGTPTYPIGRPLYSTGKTDYQGTPVTPDIAVPAAQALRTAHRDALKRKLEKTPSQKHALQPMIDRLTRELEASQQQPVR